MIVTVMLPASLPERVCAERCGKGKNCKYLRLHGSSDVTCAQQRARARRTNWCTAPMSAIRERAGEDRDDLERIRRRIPRRARRDLRRQEKAMATHRMSPRT